MRWRRVRRPIHRKEPRPLAVGLLRGGYQLVQGLLCALVGLVAGLVLLSVLPTLVGWTPSVIVSGSMYPQIKVGDVVVTSYASPKTIKPGAIVRFRDPGNPGREMMHRVVEVRADRTVTTRGDANHGND